MDSFYRKGQTREPFLPDTGRLVLEVMSAQMESL